MPADGYVIVFDFPEGKVYGGMHKGAWGFAPTLATAHIFVDAMGARRVIDNGYGTHTAPWATVKALRAVVDAS